MLAQAQAELPNECCGILAGRIVDGAGQVEARYPLVNELASPREYLAEPRSMITAFKEMRARGIVELAIYHSHPTSPPVPSAMDRERNYSPEVMSLIIGLQDEPPLVRAWWLTDTDFREAFWELISETDA
jgi:proteasome lid subunit RPN8/RPN11